MLSRSETSPPAKMPDIRSKSGTRAGQLGKAVFFFCSVVGVIAVVHICDLKSILEPAWADSHLRGSDACKTVGLYVGLVALLSPLGIPRQALSALGGYSFGATYGSIFASVGLVMGCSAGFFYSRLLARSALQQRFGRRIRKLDSFLSHNPFAMAMAIRLFPVGNNALTSLAAGVTSIPALPFIAGSAVGYLPQTVIFALLGSGIRIDPFWRVGASAFLFILASAFGLLLYKKFQGESTVIAENRDPFTPDEAFPAEKQVDGK